MNLIQNDISRCVGRFGIGPDDPICPRRQQCARYRQIAIDRARFQEGRPVFVSTGLCRDGDDHLIPMEEAQ
jgi:hypothetical protein